MDFKQFQQTSQTGFDTQNPPSQDQDFARTVSKNSDANLNSTRKLHTKIEEMVRIK